MRRLALVARLPVLQGEVPAAVGGGALKVGVQAFQVVLEALGMLELLIIDLLNDEALNRL